MTVAISHQRAHILALLALAVHAGSVARASGFEFTIPNIMRGPELYGRAPENVRWTPDGKWIYFDWLPPGVGWQEKLKPHRVRLTAGAKPEEVVAAQMEVVGPLLASGDVFRDRKHRVIAYDGDLYLVDLRKSAAHRLTETPAVEAAPRFSVDGQRIYFTRDNNVLSLDLEQGLVRQLTDIRPGSDPEDKPKPDAQKAALREQQLALFEVIKDEVKRKEQDKTTKEEHERRSLKPRYLDAGERMGTLFISTNGRALLFSTMIDSNQSKTTEVPNWIDGPCSSCGGWYDAGRRIWFVSEADGYAHLYTTDAHGADRRQLTQGKWEVLQVELSSDNRFFELHTREASPFERHYYRMPIAGGACERITLQPGGHSVTPSPDGKMLADVFSTSNRPPELFIAPNISRAALKQLTTSPTADWLSFPWIQPEIVWIPASDGVKVPARIYRPSDMHTKPNGAGIIFVHGAGYLQNAHRYWSRYAREFMFHHFLASKGYTVLDLDYRASAGYGRDWRTAVYRWAGGRDLQDQVDASRYLQKEYDISPEHVGIYGGSYGGFITLMALFTEPKHFGAGAALRAVTDWAHYSPGYTGEMLNNPQDDSEAYRRSSPIFFAEGLEDPLLIAHGMVDTNVHFQDVVRLAQRLIELGKTNWELAAYPVEDHGFVRPSSWADEYRRILELFETHLRPPK